MLAPLVDGYQERADRPGEVVGLVLDDGRFPQGARRVAELAEHVDRLGWIVASFMYLRRRVLEQRD